MARGADAGLAGTLLAAVAAGLIATAPLPASADPSSEVRIAVLDLERVRRNAAAVKAIRAQLGGYLDVYRTDTQKEEQDILGAQQELAQKRTVLSAEDYAEERKKLEERLAEAQGRVQQRRQALERVNMEAMQQVQNSLESIVAEIAKERRLGLIVRRDQVVYADKAIEITDDVLQRLDQRLPSVQISDPGG